MNVRRYNASGSTHRKGTLEMFCVTWLLTASSMTEASAARLIQATCTAPDRGAAAFAAPSVAAGSATIARIERHAVAPHSRINAAYSPDHPQPSCGSVKYGLTSALLKA